MLADDVSRCYGWLGGTDELVSCPKCDTCQRYIQRETGRVFTYGMAAIGEECQYHIPEPNE